MEPPALQLGPLGPAWEGDYPEYLKLTAVSQWLAELSGQGRRRMATPDGTPRRKAGKYGEFTPVR